VNQGKAGVATSGGVVLEPSGSVHRGNTDESKPRIASLVPSLTETLVELGLGDRLVARTRYCIHPAERVAAVPVVGGTKDVDLDRLRALAPTHVVVNVDENRRDLVAALLAWSSPPEILVTHPKEPLDNLALIDRFAAVFGAEEGVVQRCAFWRTALQAALSATQPEGRATRRVLYLIWRRPWMTVARDTYLSRLLARVAWVTLPAVEGGEAGAGRYPALRGDEAWLGDVDGVLLSSEPYPFAARHIDEAQALCPRARVRLVDGERLSWYGTRAVAGLGYLRALAAEMSGSRTDGDNGTWTSSSP